jgi:predicted RNA-binding protein with PUA domain
MSKWPNKSVPCGKYNCNGTLTPEKDVRFLIPDNVSVYGRMKIRVCSSCNNIVVTLNSSIIEDEVE